MEQQGKSYTAPSTVTTAASNEAFKQVEERVLPVIEEELRVGKELVETGRTRLVKTVEERTVPVSVDLLREETQVERVAINQPVDVAPEIRYEGDVMIVPILKEELMIVKKLVLVEELRISKRQITTTAEEFVTLRTEHVAVERSATPESNPAQLTE